MPVKLFIILALLCVLLVVAEGGRHKAEKRLERLVKNNLKCKKTTCRNECSGFKLCKKSCKADCASAVNTKLCKRNCLVNTCNNCKTCVTGCKANRRTCVEDHCSEDCPATLGKKIWKNDQCRTCLTAHCASTTPTPSR